MESMGPLTAKAIRDLGSGEYQTVTSMNARLADVRLTSDLGRRARTPGIFQHVAGDYRQSRFRSWPNLEPGAGRPFAKAHHWRAFPALQG